MSLGLSFNGSQQSEGSVIQSDLGPSLAATDPNHPPQTLYQAWKGSNGDTRIWFSTFNVSSWAAQNALPGSISTDARPALAVVTVPLADGGVTTQIWVAWKSAGSTSIFHSISSDSGSTWTQPTQIVLPSSPAVQTTDSPAIVSVGSTVYFMWKGSPDNSLYWTYYDINQNSWFPQQLLTSPNISVQSTAGPALAAFTSGTGETFLCAAWKGYPDTSLYYSFLNTTGTDWSPQTRMPDSIASTDGPSLAGFGSSLYATWKGGNGDEGLWYSAYNWEQWSIAVPGEPQIVQKEFPSANGSLYRPSVAFISSETLYFLWKGKDTDNALYWVTANIG